MLRGAKPLALPDFATAMAKTGKKLKHMRDYAIIKLDSTNA